MLLSFSLYFLSLPTCLVLCDTFHSPPVFGWFQWSPNTLRFRFTISSRYAGTRRYSSVRYHHSSPTTWTWWAGSIRTAAVTWPMDSHTVPIGMLHERGVRRGGFLLFFRVARDRRRAWDPAVRCFASAWADVLEFVLDPGRECFQRAAEIFAGNRCSRCSGSLIDAIDVFRRDSSSFYF